MSEKVQLGKEGFYRVSFTNEDGLSGFGMLCLDTGNIVGCGIAGDMWDGSYTANPREETLKCKLQVTFPKDSVSKSALTGNVYVAEGGTEEFIAELPRNFNEVTVRVEILGHKVLNVRIQKIRGFSN